VGWSVPGVPLQKAGVFFEALRSLAVPLRWVFTLVAAGFPAGQACPVSLASPRGRCLSAGGRGGQTPWMRQRRRLGQIFILISVVL